MPAEPYYEVMSYWEAKNAGVQVPMALVANVGQAASGLVTSFLQLATGASLDSLKPLLTDYLGKKSGMATSFKTATMDGVPLLVESELNADYIAIIDALKAGIGQGVGTLHSGMLENLWGTNALLGSYNSLIQQIAINPYISRWANNTYTPNIPDAHTAWYMMRIGQLSAEQYSDFLQQNGWELSWMNPLEASWVAMPSIPTLIEFVRRGYITVDTMKNLLKWHRLTDEMINETVKLISQPPEPYRLAEMHSKGLIDHDTYIRYMSWYGIDYDMASAWFAAQMTFPTFDQCMIMYRRGLIDEHDFKLYMSMQAYGEFQVNQMLGLKDVVPPIGDLIRFAVREAYLDHDPEKQYSEMVRLANLQGLTPEASGWYWYSHWDRIPITLMFENYRRGNWDVNKLLYMLKIADIHPDDRQDIINVAYVAPSIRELGYGWDVGAYTADDIYTFRRWGGLSPEDAEKATIATIAYRTEAERNGVRTELMYAYGLGKINRESLEAQLRNLPTQEEAVRLWMTRADLYRKRLEKPQFDTEGRIPTSSEAINAYKLGIRPEDWLHRALKDLDWTDDRINIAILRAKEEMAEDREKSEEVRYRKLTIAEIKMFYQLEMITKDQMTAEFIALGYSPDDAFALTEAYTLETPVPTKVKSLSSAVAADLYSLLLYDETDLINNFKLQGYNDSQAALLTMYTILSQQFPVLKIMYQKGVISGEEFVTELMKLNMSELTARQLVVKVYEEFQVDRIAHEKDLTKAEIIKGVKNNIISTSLGAELLVGLGYDENEAYYILAINKVVTAGDPEGYWDMRKVVELQRKAQGLSWKDVPDEIIQLEKQQKLIQQQLDTLKKTSGNEDKIALLATELARVESRMKQIITEKHLK